ncbi:glycosyltransferase [candidate division WWE3 bacterium]|nr:glycosyltransferase [candidate division WWE3 bacterium]
MSSKTIQTSQIETPKVTVAIPVYNGSQYIKDAIDSVEKSTFTDFEIFLINDGSTDDSFEVCKALAQNHPNITFHSYKENQGLSNVLNHILNNAKGECIARLNQDDLMRPDRLQKQVDFLEKHSDVVAVGSWIRLFDEFGEEVMVLKFMSTDEKIRKHWLYVGPFSDPTVMYRKSTALSAGGYEQDYWPADDTQFWYKLGAKGKLANLQEVLVDVRWHGEAGSLKYMGKMADSLYKAHRYAHNNVQKGSLVTQAYWVFQLLSNKLLPPRLSWWVYRQLKQGIAFVLGK